MPAAKLKSLASRTLGLWRVVKLLRDVGLRGIPPTSLLVHEQTTRILDVLDENTRAVSEINSPGYREKVLNETVAAATTAAKSAIEKSTLVLAHSILDEVATECCRISATLMPDQWMSFVLERRIELREVLRTPAEEIARQLLNGHLKNLTNESLRKRIDILNRHYQPAPAFIYTGNAYKFDGERLEQIDRHRQRIIHQLQLSGEEGESVESDLAYLEATSFYLIFMLSHKHGIEADPFADALDALYARARSPVDLAYEGLLLATSLPTSDARVWSWGGQIFAQEAGQPSKQVPLLMPAATPDISSDLRRIVFVKYRLGTGDEILERDRFAGRTESLIGDIWISDIDGSNDELVLRGGPRPDLMPPVPEFPKELAGIISTQFDPDGERVYFIADAWVTSGAIFVLNPKTGEVSFFTDGNVFVVLHGTPHRGALLVRKHRYREGGGAYDHFWLVSANGAVGEDFGLDLDSALVKLYGPGGRKLAFPRLL